LNNQNDDYDIFLETWEPEDNLLHATLPQNLSDPFIRDRLFSDSRDHGPVIRSNYAPGQKIMDEKEVEVRGYDFFLQHHEEWASHFKDYVLNEGVQEEKFNLFIAYFSKLWIDGKKRRQDSPEMLSVKASIRAYDKLYYPGCAGRFVIETVQESVQPLLSHQEMKAIFEANSGLINALLPDYIDYLSDEGPGSLGDLYVRRGVHMPPQDSLVRCERHYLSSFSLAIGPVEQFACTWTPKTQGTGTPSIFSAPLGAIQNRIIAFAPFIKSMDLSQLEIVVAPPVEKMCLQDDGLHGDIREFSFQ